MGTVSTGGLIGAYCWYYPRCCRWLPCKKERLGYDWPARTCFWFLRRSSHFRLDLRCFWLECCLGMWTISVAFALIGMFVACMFGKPLVLIFTSFVGSYLFSRAWTLFFPGHWPSEADIMEGDIETDAIFWVFLSVFIFLFAASVTVQSKRAESHPDLDSYSKN